MITVSLDAQEHEVLRVMADSDCRHPRDEMRYLLREEARRRGLLPMSAPPESDTLNTAGQGAEGDERRG